MAIYLKMLYHLHVFWLQLPEGTNVITNNKLGRGREWATSILKYCIPLQRTDCDNSRIYILWWIQQSAGARHGRWTTWIWRGPANCYITPFPTHGTKLELTQCTECGNAAQTAVKYGDLSPQTLQKLNVKNRIHPWTVSWVQVSCPRRPMWGDSNPRVGYPWGDSKRSVRDLRVGWCWKVSVLTGPGWSRVVLHTAQIAWGWGWVAPYIGTPPSCCGERWIDTTEGLAPPASSN